jgi:hypothetical protein
MELVGSWTGAAGQWPFIMEIGRVARAPPPTYRRAPGVTLDIDDYYYASMAAGKGRIVRVALEFLRKARRRKGRSAGGATTRTSGTPRTSATPRTGATRSASTPGPTEPYNRRKHYGSTPSAADRKAAGVGPDEVLDHDPPLVQRYYEGDPAKGERPGYQMTPEERRDSGSDRSRMTPQPRTESDQQGGQMAAYSRRKKKEFGL